MDDTELTFEASEETFEVLEDALIEFVIGVLPVVLVILMKFAVIMPGPFIWTTVSGKFESTMNVEPVEFHEVNLYPLNADALISKAEVASYQNVPDGDI